MLEEFYFYVLFYNLYKEYGICCYGVYGISYFYVIQEAVKMLNKLVEELNIIICYLGNGGFVFVICNGKCVDIFMGLILLEGLVMGICFGDIDLVIIFYLYDILGMSVDVINKLLIKEFGLLGLIEVISDCCYVEDNYVMKEDVKCVMDVYCYCLVKYIGVYIVLMDGCLDVVVFIGGIGENVVMVCELFLGKLGVLGFEVDYECNLAVCFGKFGFINKEGICFVVVILINEELVIV